MITALPRFRPRTIRGQMILLILIAVVAVVQIGRLLEQATRDSSVTITNPDLVTIRLGTITLLFLRASDSKGEVEILRSAAAAELDLDIVEKAAADALPAPTGLNATIGRLFSSIFPPDLDLPSNSRHVIVNNRLALAADLDQSRSMILHNVPETVLTTDMTCPLIYQILSVAMLGILFSSFIYFVVTAPLRRIAASLGNVDTFLAGDRPLDERSSREIIDLSKALNELRDRIHTLIQGRTRMLRSISHDLRTPMTRLRLRAERITDLRLREQMLLDLSPIDRMIAATLDYFRNDRHCEPTERADIASMLQTLSSDFCDAGHSVTYEGPSRLVAPCQPDGIVRALANLCDNAVKFGTTAAIRLSDPNRTLVIEVSDNGPGIPPAMHERVLEPFFRIDDARAIDTGIAGYGLGLSIVDEIVRHHDGALAFENNPRGGLTVRITLPAAMPG
ncbi:ATP-binding protein [Ensifer canadensis]